MKINSFCEIVNRPKVQSSVVHSTSTKSFLFQVKKKNENSFSINQKVKSKHFYIKPAFLKARRNQKTFLKARKNYKTF